MKKHDQTASQHARPMARADDLSITVVGDETVVYDQLTHNASCLNAVTTAVWNACDGKNDSDALLQALRRAGFQDASEEVVWLAIEQLQQIGLLEVSSEVEVSDQVNTGMNRRQMLRSLGKSAVVAIPVVSTIAIQNAAMAGSQCGVSTEPCPCCSGFTCNDATGQCQ